MCIRDRYRYSLQGSPIPDDSITDADAVRDGYISMSVLDYSLVKKEHIKDFEDHLNE